MGGQCTISTLRRFPQWCMEHIRAIAMTDACESAARAKGFKLHAWCLDHCINWICHSEPADTFIKDGSSSKHRSAGTKDHPLSTAKAWPFIWPFFDENGASKSPIEIDISSYIGEEEGTVNASDDAECRIA